jgi:hypothetical protein
LRTTLNVSAMAVILSSVFICSAPVLAAGTGGAGAGAGTGTASPANGNSGTNAGSGDSVKNIQQMLTDAEAATIANPTTNGSGNIGIGSENSAAPYQAPFLSNPGTIAESAKTTALSTSTYHQ